MPPAISDDDATTPERESRRSKKPVTYTEILEDDDDDLDMIKSDVKYDVKSSAKSDSKRQAYRPTANHDDDDDEDDDEDNEEAGEEDGGGEVFIVDKIVSHFIDGDGKVKYKVKWEGFEKKTDLTWEPEEYLASATAAVEDYLESIGGRERLYKVAAKVLDSKKRGRPSANTPTNGAAKRARKNLAHPADSESPASLAKQVSEKAFKPPPGSWENEVQEVDMFRATNGELMVLLSWKSGDKTQHKAKQCYTRCPQKILSFYETKINFTS